MKSPLYVYELPAGTEWVNTAAPVALQAFRGRALLLWFFTGSCIHCREDLGELKLLESKHPDGLSIVGVHQPRYQAECDPARLLKTLNRWFFKYPTVNDRELVLARWFGVTAWPTAVLLDAEGKLTGIYPGTGRRAEIEARVAVLLEDAATRDVRTFEATPTARKPEARAALSFPTALAASDSAVYVAETGRNRVLELAPDGRIMRVFGSGNAGFYDGRNNEAGFNGPTALALGRDVLYVADTGNHALRRIRLMSGEVETIAGTGKPASGPPEAGLPRTIALSSPSGLAMGNDKLYIAMAGMHQIWVLDLTTQSLGPWVGSGREEQLDGYGEFSAFNLPMGLSVGKDALYVADAGGNSLRAVRLSDGAVSTLVEGNPFEEGDQDGGLPARLAGPKAVAADPGRNVVWIADSINGKLKLHALGKAETKTLNLNYALNDPHGLALGAGHLWLCNTNHHELLKLDLKTGKLLRVAVAE
jgi:thiol-disulfide isomerase/thioredoxin